MEIILMKINAGKTLEVVWTYGIEWNKGGLSGGLRLLGI